MVRPAGFEPASPTDTGSPGRSGCQFRHGRIGVGCRRSDDRSGLRWLPQLRIYWGGASRRVLPMVKKPKPERIDRDERVSLYPLDPEVAIAALLKTPPP